MRAWMLSALVGSVLIGATAQPARAQWCAYYDPYTYTCGFVTFEQCLNTVRGVGGSCKRDYREEGRRERRRPGRERS